MRTGGFPPPHSADNQVLEENLVNDTQIGFSLIFGAAFVAGAIIGFRWAQRQKTVGPIAVYVILAYLWYVGTLAAYPSFVAGQGSNAFIGFSMLMIALTAAFTAGASVLWCGLFRSLAWAANAYGRRMARY